MKKLFVFIFLCLNIFSYAYANTELKGVWVASVYNLDYPSSPTTSSKVLKNEAISILNNIKELGFNAVFLQVRPSADALYKSNIFPWSKYLTGTNGVAPDNAFDPLAFWIEEAHIRGIEVHAWINPYRITKNGDAEYNALSEKSPAKIYPNYVVKHSDGNYYFNPGIPEVRTLIINGVAEIVNNYNVDGIHLDDYFYPGTDFNDNSTYEAYKNGFNNIGDWRRNNVDILVKELGEKIHSIKPYVSYGISPAGVWANNKNNPLGSNTTGSESYYSHYADSRKWVINNWIDYIAPQIYWENGNKAADYATLVNWWSDVIKNSSTKLYIGLADYRTVDVKKGNVWYNGKEISKQMQTNLTNSYIDGEIHYRYSSIISSKSLFDAIKSSYKNDEIIVRVNGKKVLFDVLPRIENNRTLVPLRAIFEALGADVSWSKNNTVTAKKGNINIKLEIGSNIMYVGTKEVKLETPAKIIDNRTLVPVRAISEAFLNNVIWNGTYKTININ